MSATKSHWLRKIAKGLLSKDHSFATGLLLALLVWTLTRLVDGVAGGATVEYAIADTSIQLKNGKTGRAVSVVLTNISRDSALKDLGIAIHDPKGAVEFIKDTKFCTYPEPTWIRDGSCIGTVEGLEVTVPSLVPGTQVRAGIGYLPGAGEFARPVVRIKPGEGEAKLALVETGLRTWIVRHEMLLLLLVLLIAGTFICLSVAAGINNEKTDNKI